MATTPSGMSIADAEALSKQQQAEIMANLPKEGEYFRTGDTSPIQQIKNGQIVTIKPEDILGTQQVRNAQGGIDTLPNWGAAANTGGEWQNYYNAVNSQLGVNYGNLSFYNPGDIKQGFRNPQVAMAGTNTGTQTQGTGWIDPASGNETPVGVGIPAPSTPSTTSQSSVPAGATYIDNPAKLSGLTEAQIWREPGTGRIYKLQQATLTSPTGTKKVVAVGSTEANNLLKSGWTLGDKIGGGTITANTLMNENELNIGSGTTGSGSSTDAFIGGVAATSKSTDEWIKYYQDLLTPKESDLSLQVKKLIGEAETAAGALTGQGAAQLAAEEQAGIQAKTQTIAAKNTLLKTKLAEVDALTKSYELANQTEEGRPQTLSRLQGAQAQNYKLFIAQKNLLASEAGIMQAEILGLQQELEASQNAANRAVDLAYADKESYYNSKLAQLNILLPQLDKEEAKYGNAVKMMLEQQANTLAEQKTQQKELLSFNLSLMAENPSAGIKITDSPEVATQKVAAMLVKVSGGRTSGGGGGGFIPSTPTPIIPQQTFEQFIADKEKGLGMSLNNPEQYRGEYNQLISSSNVTPTTKAQNANLSGYSYQVQQVLKGNMSAGSILSGGTAGERAQYARELADAENKGLLTTSNEERLYSGLDSQTASAVKSKVSSFKSEPIISNFNVVNEGWNTVQNIANNSKNPSDHQALIYAFAKIMDPNSVVRESEYATVQKYSQSLVDAYGKKITNAINGTGILSEDAVKNMKATLKTKYESSLNNYKNVYNQYIKGIDSITGRDDGEKFVIDYSTAFNSTALPNNNDPLPAPAQQGFWSNVGNWLFGE